MSSKFTILLGAIALVLVGLLVFGPGGLHNPMSVRVGDFVLDFPADDVRSIEIDRDGEKVLLTRVPDGWLLGPDPEDRANAAVAERILTAAQTLLVLDAISPAEFKEKYRGQDFGFANPRQRLRLETRSGTKDLLFGREGAGENQVFVRSQEGADTFLVPDQLQKLLLEPVESFRDPRLIPLPTERIERVRLERPDGMIELERKGPHWRLARPLQDWANSAAVNETLEFILGARIFSFMPMDEAPPEIVWNSAIEILPEGEEEPIRLRVADVPDAEEIYLEHPARNALVTVPGDNFHLLRMPLDELRSRQLLHFNPDFVDRLSVRVGEESAEFARNGDGEWRERTAADEETIDPAAINTLFELLETTTVDAFLIGDAQTTQSAPAAEIHLNSWLSENTPEAAAGLYPLWELDFWKVPAGDGLQETAQSLVVRINEEPGLRKLPASFLEDLKLWLQSL